MFLAGMGSLFSSFWADISPLFLLTLPFYLHRSLSHPSPFTPLPVHVHSPPHPHPPAHLRSSPSSAEGRRRIISEVARTLTSTDEKPDPREALVQLMQAESPFIAKQGRAPPHKVGGCGAWVGLEGGGQLVEGGRI